MEKHIDIVIPMVFPKDREWQQLYNRYHGGAAAAVSNVRFRSWDTEELLVRCCLKYMPWLRQVHLLLAFDSQVQPWMERIIEAQQATDGPRVRIVFHRDFMPADRLPCFASPCIEMFLGSIPDLSEEFIYANDDMFPLSPLEPTDFFRDGRPCHHFKEKEIPNNPSLFQRKCIWQMNMLAAPFGIHFTTTYLKPLHSFAPILRSSCHEVMRRHGKEIMHHLSPFCRTDRSCNHYIYMLWQHFSGLSIDAMPRERLVCKNYDTDAVADIIRDPDAGIICLNDNAGLQDWEKRARIVRNVIRQKLSL